MSDMQQERDMHIKVRMLVLWNKDSTRSDLKRGIAHLDGKQGMTM